MSNTSTSGAPQSAPLGFAGTVLLVELVVLVLVQGGYFGTAVCVCGIVSWAVFLGLAVQWRTLKGLGVVPALFLALALCYALGLFANGFDLTGASETAVWFAVAGAGALAFQLEEGQRSELFGCIAVFGALYALVGIVVFLFFPDAGLVRNGRLEMSFQYANAAGSFMAVCFWLGVLSRRCWVRIASVLSLVGLALTQSGGSAAAFCVAGVVFAAVWGGRQQRFLQNARPALRSGIAAVAALALVCVAVFAASLLLPDRVGGALQTFAERGVQVHDGLALLLTGPFLGIGPDAWQFAYPYVQTAQYRVAVVHCSFLQVALDSGVLGLAVLVAAIVLGFRSQIGQLRRLGERRERRGKETGGSLGPELGALLALVFLCAHSLLDFDLQFGSLAMLFALLLADPHGPVLPRNPRAAEIAVSGACAVVCLAGSFAGLPYTFMTADLRSGDAQSAVGSFEASPIARGDVPLQTLYLQAALASGDYGRVQAWCDGHGVATDEQAVIAYQALYAAGARDSAASVLLEQLEAQPYNYTLYKQAIDLVSEQSLDKAQNERLQADIAAFDDRAGACSRAGLPGQRRLR